MIKKFIDTQVIFNNIPNNVQTWFIEIMMESDDAFFRKLIHFWSAVNYPRNTKYQVAIGEKIATKTVCPFPEAHTCFQQLVLPKSLSSKQQLKAILEKAFQYVETGIGLY